MTSCQHDVIYEVDYNVTLDPANTYYAGDPVKFNLTGDVQGQIRSSYRGCSISEPSS